MGLDLGCEVWEHFYSTSQIVGSQNRCVWSAYHLLGAVKARYLRALIQPSQSPCGIDAMVTPILQMSQLRFRKTALLPLVLMSELEKHSCLTSEPESFTPFQKEGDWELENPNNLCKITQLVIGEPGSEVRIVQIICHACYTDVSRCEFQAVHPWGGSLWIREVCGAFGTTPPFLEIRLNKLN